MSSTGVRELGSTVVSARIRGCAAFGPPAPTSLPPGSTPFQAPYVYRSSSMMFNIADYGHTLMTDFLLAGGKFQHMEFHAPQDIARLPDIASMGFDVIYFPPIHPIGATNRKGRNNSKTSQPGEPGVPYAIGNSAQGVNGGGHKDIAPELV